VREDQWARRLTHGFVEWTRSEWGLSICGHDTWTFKQKALTLNQSLFRSSHVDMNLGQWLKEYYTKCMLQMGFLRRVCGMLLRNKVRSCRIHKAVKVKPLFRIERFQLRWVRPRDQNALGRQAAGKTNGRATQRSYEDQVDRLHFRLCLVPSFGDRRSIRNCCWPWGM